MKKQIVALMTLLLLVSPVYAQTISIGVTPSKTEINLVSDLYEKEYRLNYTDVEKKKDDGGCISGLNIALKIVMDSAKKYE